MRAWQVWLILGLLLLSCGGNGGGALSKGNRGNVIYQGTDTNPTTGIDTANTTGLATGTGTGTATGTDAGVSVGDAQFGGPSAGDAGPGAPWTADQIFPSCKGAVDEVSECIINLPSKFGTPVTSAAPMDFNACKP
jgi:hypothetical protein